MSPERPVAHEWVRQRWGPWAAGILSAEDQQALETHLESCEACRKAAGDLAAGTPHDPHIPSALLARWDRTAATLTGELRTLVQSHIEDCEDCRRELTTLGFDPGLIRQPRLEPSSALPPRVLAPRRWQWTRRHSIAAGALATAAGVLLVSQLGILQGPSSTPSDQTAHGPNPAVVPATPHPAPSAGGTVPPGTRPAPHPEAPALLALGPWRSDAVRLAETLRGDSLAPIPVFSFDPKRHEIAIEPPRSLALAAGDRLELEIVNEAGTTRRALETTMRAMFPLGAPRVIVLREGDPPLPPGHYVLRIRVSGITGEAPEQTSLPFDIGAGDGR